MGSEIPPYFRPLFWSYDISQLDLERDRRRIVVQTLNYGAWKHWKWLCQRYGKEMVRNVVESVPQTEFRPGALRLATLLFSVRKHLYASRSAYARRRQDL